MKKIYQKTLLCLYTALVFFTPLIFARSTSELYEFPKTFFVYFFGVTVLLLFLMHRYFGGIGKLKKPDKFITAYVFFIAFSVIFSTHVYTSIWGYYSRFNDGLISTLIFFGIYLVGINFLDEKKVKMLKNLMALSLLPISLYGVFQSFTTERVFSTLGQPNWLAAYIVFLFPLVLENVAHEHEKAKKYFWLFIIINASVCLWLTRSLSGMLALAVSLAFLTLSIKIEKKNYIKVVLPALLILGVFSAFNFNYFKNRLEDALTFSTDASTYKVSDPGLIRLGLWRGSFRLATSSVKNFTVGTGPETFPYEFPFFRDPILNYSSEWSFILNKPHNYFLEILTESGIFALLAYILVLFNFTKVKNKYLVAGMIAFSITNIFGWPTVSTSLLFWMWLIFGSIPQES